MNRKSIWTKIGVMAMGSGLGSCALMGLSIAFIIIGNLLQDEIIVRMAKDGFSISLILFFLTITAVALAGAFDNSVR